MTDWSLIERLLDDRTAAHACAFCGEHIPAGDDTRWSLAVRRLDGHTSVVWVHGPCFVARLQAPRRCRSPSSPSPP